MSCPKKLVLKSFLDTILQSRSLCIRTKMKKYKVLGDLGNVIQALDEIDQDKLLKTGVNEIINIHMKILKNQQRELKNLTKELKKEVKSPNKKVIL